MNSEFPTDPRQALEVSLTAMLLGELPSDQTEFLRRAIAQDAELANIYERLRQTIELVGETEKTPVQQPAANPVPLKLSDDRRQVLLQHFKTVTPKELTHVRSRSFSWFLPLAVAASFLFLIGGLLLPALTRSKSSTASLASAALSRRSPAVDIEGRRSKPLGAFPSGGQSFRILSEAAPPTSVTPPPKAAIILPRSEAGNTKAPELAVNGSSSGMFGGFGKQEMARVELNALAKDPSLTLGDNTTPIPTLNVESYVPIAPQVASSQVGLSSGYGGYGAAPAPRVNVAGDAVIAGGVAGGAPGSAALSERLAYQFQALTVPAAATPTTPPAKAAAGRYGLARGARVEEKVPRSTSDESKAQDLTMGVPLAVEDTAKGLPIPSEKAEAAGRETSPASASPAKDVHNFGLETHQRLDEAKLLEPAKKQVQATERAPQNQALYAELNRVRDERYKAAEAKKERDSRERLVDVEKAWSVSGELRGFYDDKKDDRAPVLADQPAIGKAVEEAGFDFFESSGRKQSSKEDALNTAPAATATASSRSSGQQGVYSVNAAGYVNVPTSTNFVLSAPARQVPSRGKPQAQKQFGELAHAGSPTRDHSEAVLKLNGLSELDQQVALAREKVPQLQQKAAPKANDEPATKPATPAPIPQPEIQTAENAFSTFSLNVSDVSFKTAAASLEKGAMPEPGSIRSEEFINTFDYRDPEPAPSMPVGFSWDRARYPFAQNRDVLRFAIKTAAQGRQAGRPLNIVLLLDNSGSMERADRVRIIREALKVLAAQLQPQDKLSVVTFARTAQLRVDGVPGNEAGQQLEAISGLTPEGGTNLEEAMNLAYETALKHYLPNSVNRVVLMTDGAANLGDVEPDNLKKKVEDHRKQGIALDCFGIGWEGYNDDLLEALSRNGDGRYGFINSPEEAATEFAPQLAGALRVAASDVKVQVEFNPKRVTAWRQIGYAKHQLTKEQFRDNTVDAAEIGAAESGNALYVIEVNPAGDGPLGIVRVRYKVPGTADYHEHEWPVAYNGSAASLEQAGPAIRLATCASAFSEWLATSPFASEVTTDALLRYLGGVPEVYGADPRPRKLEWMIRAAGSLAGK